MVPLFLENLGALELLLVLVLMAVPVVGLFFLVYFLVVSKNKKQ